MRATEAVIASLGGEMRVIDKRMLWQGKRVLGDGTIKGKKRFRPSIFPAELDIRVGLPNQPPSQRVGSFRV